jgi:hypothetical protein
MVLTYPLFSHAKVSSVSITITILVSHHRPMVCLKYNVSETVLCLRLQVIYT